MDLTPVAVFGVLLVRPGVILALAPLFAGTYVPSRVKVALTVLLAVTLAPTVPVPPLDGGAGIAGVLVREMAIGLALGITVRALVAGAEFAGHLAGHQIGFTYAATVDPASGVRNGLLSSLYGMLATLAFLAVDGHHMVLRALVVSYQGLPIGGGRADDTLLAGVREVFALVFTVGVRLAAPVVLVLLVVEVGVGLISRAAPPLNFMVIGFPLRMLVGLVVLAVVIGVVPAVIAPLTERSVEMGLRLAAAFR
jgi:flagellar biosynthesis protein FliR